ncbi:hypothetical protein EYR27_18380 [Xanthomonas oryzae]|nr:hypothetical protein EYR27_18380 [Xanthomonas oryzae]
MFLLGARDGSQPAMVARAACNARRLLRRAQSSASTHATGSSKARIAFLALQSCGATVRSCPRLHRARLH